MADKRKVFTMQGVGIPVSAAGQGGKAGPQPSSSSNRTSLAGYNDIVSSESSMKQRCAACRRFTTKVNKRKKIVESSSEANAFSLCFGKSITPNDVLCWSCRIIACKNRKLNDGSRFLNNERTVYESDDSSQSSEKDPEFEVSIKSARTVSEDVEYVHIQIQRTVVTHKYCCVCYKTKDLTVVPKQARVQSYIKKRIYIPEGNRCCRAHLIKSRFFDEELSLLRVYSNFAKVKDSELSELLEGLSIECDTTILDKVGDFSLSKEKIHLFTGLTWENIIELREMLTSMRNNETRDVTQALVVFLLKLRSGNSNKMVAAILQLEREQLVSEYSASIMNSFEKDVLPSRFGLNAISRRDLIDFHTTDVSKLLFNSDDELMLICDGTYARHQKSSNNEYQRKSYSGQKKVPLCKPFTICTTTGRVLDMAGPFYANQNDAEIIKNLIKDPHGLCLLMNEGDKLFLDRGFRDAKDALESKGFIVLMPALKGKRNQLTTKESNQSRFVTKIRWAVESVHGIIKQKYRLLDHVIDNKLLPKVGLYFKIAAFLHNQFGKALQTDVQLSEEIVTRMKQHLDMENTLANEAEEKGWFRKKLMFQSVSSKELLDFPELTEKDLKILFTGSYQLSQAVSYLAEMMNDNGSFNLQFVKEQANILKVQVQSRHISRKVYRCFIDYKPHSVGVAGIKRYACDCANGRRTVGCCSHIAAIIYYLSHARYLSKIVRPAEILSKLFTQNSMNPVIEEDSEED